MDMTLEQVTRTVERHLHDADLVAAAALVAPLDAERAAWRGGRRGAPDRAVLSRPRARDGALGVFAPLDAPPRGAPVRAPKGGGAGAVSAALERNARVALLAELPAAVAT